MQNKILDIVIVSYAKDNYCKDLTRNCINSIIDSEDNSVNLFNIIVVESNHEVVWDKLAPNIKTYCAPLPYGYNKFLNFGRKKGDSPWIALCNNDLIFEKNWFTNILKASKLIPEALSFSPICPITQKLYGIHTNTGLIEGYEIRKQISGWCIVQKKEIYEKMGDLDERFSHWFCDNDYSMELLKNKIKHVLVTDSIVLHHDKNIGKTTERVIEDYDLLYKMTSGSLPIFREKWETIKK